MLLELAIVLLFICACGYAGLGMWTSRQRRRLGLAGGPRPRGGRLATRLSDAALRATGPGGGARSRSGRGWHAHSSRTEAVRKQCTLLEEHSGARPTHAVLVLANGRQERVLFTSELEDQLAGTMRRMRQVLESNAAPGPCWSRAKCLACGYRQICWGYEPIGSMPRAEPC
jgi:Domain of unknown function DUF83